MNIEQFAKDAGVSIVEVDPGWGGPIGYTEADHPNSTVCGFRTATAAYNHWLQRKFGKHTADAIRKLLEGTK